MFKAFLLVAAAALTTEPVLAAPDPRGDAS
jgi:hypothetical protein